MRQNSYRPREHVVIYVGSPINANQVPPAFPEDNNQGMDVVIATELDTSVHDLDTSIHDAEITGSVAIRPPSTRRTIEDSEESFCAKHGSFLGVLCGGFCLIVIGFTVSPLIRERVTQNDAPPRNNSNTLSSTNGRAPVNYRDLAGFANATRAGMYSGR